MAQRFNLQDFRSAFEVFTKIKPKLQPYLAQFKEHNMQYLIGALEQLYHLFYDEGVQINYKFHSMFGIKLIFDLADPFIINLIEIYFLPKIFQVASYQTDKTNDKRGQDYFAQHGYPADTPEIVKMGFTWVKLASEFICAAAVVKPRKMFETEELDEPSKYTIALNKLEQTGWKRYPTPAYYKEGAPQAIRKNYINNLQNLTEDSIGTFSDFYVQQYRMFIHNGRPYTGNLDPKKLIENCDSFVTSTLISLCVQEFAHPSIKRKLNSIQLVDSMIKWGDIEAAHLVNCTDFIDETAREIGNPNLGSNTLSRGKNIFSKINGAEELKKQFYVEFLKCIHFWSLCYPKSLKKKGKDSKIKAFHDELRNKLQIQFPEDRQLKEKKAIFDKAAERQRKRNQALLDQLEQEDPQFVSFIGKGLPLQSRNPYPGEITKKQHEEKPPGSKKGIDSNSIISNTPAGPTPLGSDYEIWKRQISEVEKSLGDLAQSQSKLDTKLARIQSFRMRYEKDLQTAILSETQFDDIFMKAQTLLEKIEKIQPHIVRYRARSYTYEQFIEAVTGRKLASSRSKAKAEEHRKEQRRDEKVPSRKEVNSSSNQLGGLGSFVSKSKQSVDNFAGNLFGGRNQEKKPEKKSATAQIAEQFSNMTPIKRAQFGQDDSKDMSLLPGISKHSIEKEDDNIEPASHGSGFGFGGFGVESIRDKVGQVEESAKKIKQETKEEVKDWLNMAKNQSAKKIGQIEKNVGAKVDELQEEIEQGVGAHVPKSLKNIGGAYKLQAGDELSRVKETIGGQIENLDSRFERRESNGSPISKSRKLQVSLAQSRKTQKSKINFEESMASHISRNLDDDDDIIMAPESNPLEQSFHEIKDESRYPTKSKQLSFKQCFEEDKYLFGNDRFSKKFKLATDTFNLIKRSESSGKKSRNKDSTISIPSLLNERNKKYQEEMRYIEDRKNRQISQLEKKVKVLETTGQVMKDRIVQQERQMRSIRASSQADGGSVKKASIMEDQQLMYKRFSAQNKSVKERSFYGDSRAEQKFLDPMGKLIQSRRFSNYFDQFKNEKQKRLLIKNKELLLKNDSIEFGCMSRRQRESIVITYYITPSMDLDGLVSRVNKRDENLQIDVEPKNIPSIRRGKQEKVIVTVHLIQAPYYLPQIQFSYNLQNRLDTQRFLIPCAFHKFVNLTPVNQLQVSRQFDRKQMLKRGQEVPYSRKLLKNISMLTDYFPGGTLLRHGQPNEKGQIQFVARAQWRRSEFWIRLMIRPSQFLYIQLLSREQNDTCEYYASLVTNLLMKNIDLQEM